MASFLSLGAMAVAVMCAVTRDVRAEICASILDMRTSSFFFFTELALRRGVVGGVFAMLTGLSRILTGLLGVLPGEGFLGEAFVDVTGFLDLVFRAIMATSLEIAVISR